MIKNSVNTTTGAGEAVKFRNATLMLLQEKVRIVADSEEMIFGVEYVSGLNSGNRIGKFRKDALSFEDSK